MEEKLSPPEFYYDVFISYRHVEPDKTIAARLHSLFETYRVPRALVKKGTKKTSSGI